MLLTSLSFQDICKVSVVKIDNKNGNQLRKHIMVIVLRTRD